MTSHFLDSSILIYAFSDDPRQAAAARLVGMRPVVSVQCLNEFAAVVRGKLGKDWAQIRAALALVDDAASRVVPLTVAIQRHGIELAQQFGFSVYDAMIVAAALSAGCDTLWSGDMHDGLVVDGRLTIRNPFA